MLNLQEITDPDYWRGLLPDLHINGIAAQPVEAFDLPPSVVPPMRGLLAKEGYLHLQNIGWGNHSTRALAEGVQQLVGQGMSPAFAFMYDEYWVPYYKLHHVIQAVFAGQSYYMLPDFWVWHIDPRKQESGWRPHRDKGHESLYPDGSPKSITIWLPLSDASPLNGCMYIVPADRDPTYGTSDEGTWRFEYGDIRALPAQAGDIFIWNQAVLHWGSHASERAQHPRISMAFEFQRADVAPMNQPLMAPLLVLSFEQRLQLVCKQILQYQHMYPLDEHTAQVAQGIAQGLPVPA